MSLISMEIWVININISNLLDLIKKEASSLPGDYERRLPSVSRFPIYLSVEIPSNLYKFSFVFKVEFIELFLDDGTEGFSVSIIEDYKNNEYSKFSINLLNAKYADIFLILCTDLLNILKSEEKDDRTIFTNFNKRLDYWRQFLKRSRNERLSFEAEIGLIGELLFLKELLVINDNFDLMTSWKGPLGSSHDFQVGETCIEVKTSTSKQKRFIKISSEFQLENEPFQKLYLCHFEINECTISNKSFNLITLIDDIKHHLDFESHALFDGLLALVGFRNSDSFFYERKNYSLLDRNFYDVKDEFPRLTNQNLSSNISDVQYKLSLVGLDDYKVIDDDFFNLF